ncbi:FtsX-like permease family protein [Actinoplanes utahensis]|uniref:ABC3 transporter permease C-terminal domain-containing protein n=1 Tax=Actinoplanes utahensis TaxID=1869 RepID=A0A0A6UPP7_ACTUT|nr:FtsX-like permease family protein [Actinoplanes utahensis]KHD77416.1 hypothetical protein MB27_11850 [Actinoplanes utahensis]GIF32807.1 hypothetical protein Aut01nite_57930 [Actinoplanes utahensis]
MSRTLAIGRLAVRDLRRRPVEAALLLLALLAATTTLTLGLVLRDAAADPYRSTREATHGPDVVALAGAATLEALAAQPGVAAHSGPFPVAGGRLEAGGHTRDVQMIGRDTAATAVDQPEPVDGGWIRDGGVVLEAAFADALGVHTGDSVTVNGRSFRVAGTAVTAGAAPYPGATCLVTAGCMSGPAPAAGTRVPDGLLRDPGLIWLTRSDMREVTPDQPLSSYVVSLRLSDPGDLGTFIAANTAAAGDPASTDPVSPGASSAGSVPPGASSPGASSDDPSSSGPLFNGAVPGAAGGGPAAVRLIAWTEIRADATAVAADAQILLMIGAWLLGLLAIAGLAVLVGGRMADRTRRVGLIKAVGGTPAVVAAVLLTEHLLVALAAAAAGLLIGSLTAPLLTASSAGLVGSAGIPPMTGPTAATVTGVALAVAVLATAVPAVRAARTSTVRALADAARPPRRSGWLIAVSSRLPVPLLLSLRVAARRPRRTVLAAAGIAVTVSGLHVALILTGFLARPDAVGYSEPQAATLRRTILVWTVTLLILAAVNAVVIAWATVLDNRRTSALARSLGATPAQVSLALAAAQTLPALAGAVLGVYPGGPLLLTAINTATGGDSDRAISPGPWQLLTLILATAVAVAVLTAIPARLATRHPVTESLRAEPT